MTKTEAMFIHVFVRRAEVGGAAPFTWEIRGAAAMPIEVSAERFKSMHAAYETGKARLAELKRSLLTPRSAVRLARDDAKAQDQSVAA